jgi:hypothetical protein
LTIKSQPFFFISASWFYSSYFSPSLKHKALEPQRRPVQLSESQLLVQKVKLSSPTVFALSFNGLKSIQFNLGPEVCILCPVFSSILEFLLIYAGSSGFLKSFPF